MMYLMQIYVDLKKYRQALRIAAIGLVILPDMEEAFIQRWAKMKNYALTENCKDVQVCKSCNLEQSYLFYILQIQN
jgi:hypothetical protein